jgi:hypothetical protein
MKDLTITISPGVLVAFLILVVIPTWKICRKAGFPGWLGIAIAFPFLNAWLLYYLAFAPWPALEDSQSRRERDDERKADV